VKVKTERQRARKKEIRKHRGPSTIDSKLAR